MPAPRVQGTSRDTVLVCPPVFDDYIMADNPVRFIDAFVDQLDLQELGFPGVIAATEGRPVCAPSDLLKLYVYGYLNRVRSSRLFPLAVIGRPLLTRRTVSFLEYRLVSLTLIGRVDETAVQLQISSSDVNLLPRRAIS